MKLQEDQWQRKKQTKEQAREAKRAKLDPEAADAKTAKDVMVFAGLIRYKLPGRVWETLARAGQDLGAY